MKVLFRVNSIKIDGAGHIFRSMKIAEYFKKKGHSVKFLLSNSLENYNNSISKFDYYLLPDFLLCSKYLNKFLLRFKFFFSIYDISLCNKEIKKYNPDLIVIDNYRLNFVYHLFFYFKYKIFVIDDKVNLFNFCDYILDQTSEPIHYKFTTFPWTKKLTGPKYFINDLKSKINGKNLNFSKLDILIFFSAGHDNGFTLLSLKALCASNLVSKISSVTVLVSKFTAHLDQIKKICKNNKFVLICKSINLNEIYCRFNFCIGSAGYSSLERASLGIPSLILMLDKNQERNYNFLKSKNTGFFIDHKKNIKYDDYLNIFNSISNIELHNCHLNCLKLFDNKGLSRIYKVIEDDEKNTSQ